MPATENNRRNEQRPVLENPSLPDHDRTKDEGMHAAVPREMMESQETRVGNIPEGDSVAKGAIDDTAISAPDQEFTEMMDTGIIRNSRIPEDPNNWLTSDAEIGYGDGDPENRGESLVDAMEGDKH